MSFTYKGDYDYYGHPEVRDMGELLELVKIDIQRVFYLLGPRMGKVSIIRKSLNGFHVTFPFSKLTKEEVDWLVESSPMDSGYKWWIRERGCSTLRISNKVILKEVGSRTETKRFVGKRVVKDIPYILEAINNPYM